MKTLADKPFLDRLEYAVRHPIVSIFTAISLVVLAVPMSLIALFMPHCIKVDD